jgi:phosphohistidine phosphatase
MKIYIVRHGIAEERSRGGDRARALTEEGRKKMKEAAEGLAGLDPEIDTIFSSPLVRAVQTAEIIAKALNHEASTEVMDELSPGNSPEDVTKRLRNLKGGGNVILAGHEPNCSDLAGYLLGGTEIEFKKGAICLIETDSLASGSGRLLWHLSPQVARLMAK